MSHSEMVDAVRVSKRVALVGASMKEDRMSNRVHRYLKANGFEVHPVNPSLAGQEVNGDVCLGSLRELPVEVDLVTLFLSPANQAQVLEDLKGLPYRPHLFFQPGAENPEAQQSLEEMGFKVFPGCVMAVHMSLGGR